MSPAPDRFHQKPFLFYKMQMCKIATRGGDLESKTKSKSKNKQEKKSKSRKNKALGLVAFVRLKNLRNDDLAEKSPDFQNKTSMIKNLR